MTQPLFLDNQLRQLLLKLTTAFGRCREQFLLGFLDFLSQSPRLQFADAVMERLVDFGVFALNDLLGIAFKGNKRNEIILRQNLADGRHFRKL